MNDIGPDIGPRLDMTSLPRLSLPDEPVKNAGFKGRLLSSKDGCGISEDGAEHIHETFVGRTAATNCIEPFFF